MKFSISEVQKMSVLWYKFNRKYKDRLVSEKEWEVVARIIKYE